MAKDTLHTKNIKSAEEENNAVDMQYIKESDEETTDDVRDEYYSDSKEDQFANIDSFRLYLATIGKDEILTHDEESELAIKAQNGDLNARNTLVERNQKLVVSIAKKYVGYSYAMSIEDLTQEGMFGLIRAIKTYDPDKSRFSTYATWWIRQSIQRALTQSDTIRLPVHMVESALAYNKWLRQYKEDNIHEPSLEESKDYIKNELNCEYESLTLALRSRNMVSINKRINTEEDSEIGDFIPEEGDSVEKQIINKQLRDDVLKILNSLFSDKSIKDVRMKDVIIRRYGLSGSSPETLEEIAKGYNVTRERVRQIEAKALKRLRVNKQSKIILKPYITE